MEDWIMDEAETCAERMWWEDAVTPRKFKEAIIDGLNNNENLFVTIPQNLPWREELFSEIEEAQTGDLVRLQACNDPEQELLEEFVSFEMRMRYRRPAKLGTFLAGLTEKTVFHRRRILIDLENPERIQAWWPVVLDYLKARQNEQLQARFLIFSSESPDSEISKLLTCLNYEDYVREYDIEAFGSALAAPMDIEEEYMPYLARLCYGLSESQPEIMDLFCRQANRFMQFPEAAAKELNALHHFGSEKYEAFLDRKIWKAQIQILFPALEEIRLHIIDKYNSDISWSLTYYPITDTKTGKEVGSPYDLEAGELIWYAYNSGDLHFSSEDWSVLLRIRDIRNNLAHVHPVPWVDASYVLEKRSVLVQKSN